MMDRTHNDKGQKVRAIIDNALSELVELGVETKDEAAFLMAIQAAIRIDSNDKMRQLETYVIELVWDVDDTGRTIK